MTPRTRYLVSTAGLLAVAAAYFLLQGGPPRPAPRLPHPPGGASRPVPPPRPLTARDLLDRRAELGLTPGQVGRLERLEQQWRERSRDLEKAVGAAQQAFARDMPAQAAVRTSVAELERRSAEFRELSAELRQRRRLHAEAAAEVLTESQRRHAVPPASPVTHGEGR